MNPVVKEVEALPGHKPKIKFSNNGIREFDVSPYLDKGIFAELKDEKYFAKVKVAFGSVEWPNDQDFSYDTLYLKGSPLGT